MKKLLLILLISFGDTASAQYLTQSAEGKSSIPLPLDGVGIGIDIGKSELTFGFNNYERIFRGTTNWLIGVNLSAKNEEGIGNLFSTGKIVPAGLLQGFAGYSIANNNALLERFKGSDAAAIATNENVDKKKLFGGLKDQTILAVKLSLHHIKDISEREGVIAEMSTQISDIQDFASLDNYVKDYKSNDTAAEIVTFKKEFLERHSVNVALYTKSFRAITAGATEQLKSAFDNYLKKSVPIRATIFLTGGMNGRNFTRYLGIESSDLPKAFQDTLFKGGNVGLGLNLQVRNFWLGATYNYVSGDNYANLKSKEYTLKTTDNAGNQSLTAEKKITAFAGKYAKVATNELNLDLVGDFWLSDTSRLLANLYLRSSIFSRDTAYLQNYTNIGAGFYFIGNKGKFLGGLYVELPDINNNAEKSKPLAERDIQPPFRKLSFGIVTKFNLSAIFGFANKPAMPAN